MKMNLKYLKIDLSFQRNRENTPILNLNNLGIYEANYPLLNILEEFVFIAP